MRRVSSLASILGVGALAAAVLATPAFAEDKPSYKWFSTIRDGNYFQYTGECAQARAKFEQALAISANEEEKADVLVRIAKTYEGEIRRDDAIAAWKRVVGECPSSGLLPRVFFRLGELHRSITLLPLDASDDERHQVNNQMRNETAVVWFEKAVESGLPYERYVLSSKIYLAGIYMDLGREDEAWGMLDQLASLDVDEVQTPAPAGPFDEAEAWPATLMERIDAARSHAQLIRHTAMVRLVEWSLKADAVASISALEKLADRYAGTEVEEMALEKIQEILGKLSEQAHEEIANDALEAGMD